MRFRIFSLVTKIFLFRNFEVDYFFLMILKSIFNSFNDSIFFFFLHILQTENISQFSKIN